MGNQLLEKHFGRIGARVKTYVIPEPTWRHRPGIDIGSDRTGEFFDIKIALKDDIEYEVIDVRKDLRHLLMLGRREDRKEKFLCGHDERHWFVCAVPGRSVTNVVNAMEALQPAFVQTRIERRIDRMKNRFDRRNRAYVRQGEWFFVPFPDLELQSNFVNQIRKNEPISRGNGSKPHVCEQVYRTRGEQVWVCAKFQHGVRRNQYEAIIRSNPKARNWNWRAMQINASVFVRGTVRHPDHKTIVLDGWHQVLMNTEFEAPGAQRIVFLD